MKRLALPAIAVWALGCGATSAGQLAEPPSYEPTDQTKCKVSKSQSKPLIVEWPAADRAELEAAVQSNVVVVRYAGCEMRLETGCRAPGKYAFTKVTAKTEKVTIRDEDELYANIPVYAASFEGKLQKSGQLDIDMTLVGQFRADRHEVKFDELEGRCAAATHFVVGYTVGAFEFAASGAAEVGAGAEVAGFGAGARSRAARELLRSDGDAASCSTAAGEDAPPDGCGALLRIEVLPIAGLPTPAAAPAGGAAGAGSPAEPYRPAPLQTPGNVRRKGRASYTTLSDGRELVVEGSWSSAGTCTSYTVGKAFTEQLGERVRQCLASYANAGGKLGNKPHRDRVVSITYRRLKPEHESVELGSMPSGAGSCIEKAARETPRPRTKGKCARIFNYDYFVRKVENW